MAYIRTICRILKGPHLFIVFHQVKAKKLQREEERSYEVMSNNLILLRHLTEIASSKRVNDGNKPKEDFPHLYEQIMLFRRNQLQEMDGKKPEEEDEIEDKLRFFVNSEEIK